MNQLFNIKLRRSDVRKRLDVNDEDTVVLQDKVAELMMWRKDLEERFK